MRTSSWPWELIPMDIGSESEYLLETDFFISHTFHTHTIPAAVEDSISGSNALFFASKYCMKLRTA